MHEFVPKHMMDFNAILETHPHTYYFSVSTSLKGKRIMSKRKEMLSETKKTTAISTGFDIEIDRNIIYINDSSIHKVAK